MEALVEYLHDLSGDTSWLDEEIGTVSDIGWHGFISFDEETARKVAELGHEGGRSVYSAGFTGAWGALLTEDSLGHRSVRIFDDSESYFGAIEEVESFDREFEWDDEEVDAC